MGVAEKSLSVSNPSREWLAGSALFPTTPIRLSEIQIHHPFLGDLLSWQWPSTIAADSVYFTFHGHNERPLPLFFDKLIHNAKHLILFHPSNNLAVTSAWENLESPVLQLAALVNPNFIRDLVAIASSIKSLYVTRPTLSGIQDLPQCND